MVEGFGPIDAAIVAVGEAPGATEAEIGRPFVGASGNLWNVILDEVGIKRPEIRIENLCEERPPHNKIEALSSEVLAKWVRDLRNRIADLKGKHVIVPMGNYACFALTGKGKVKAGLRKALGEAVNATEAEKKAGITKLRGSIYQYTDINGAGCKVIPTIHPAWYLHGNMKRLRRAYVDWGRIKKEATSHRIVRRPRKYLIDPAPHEIEQYIQFIAANPQVPLSIDIETWGNTLSCVGFAHSPDYSITITTVSKEQREKVFPYIKWLCETQNPKILQNGLYDTYWLKSYGIRLNNWVWDTMAMHHAFDPTDEHALDYLCSIYIEDYRYWKDEAKDAEEIKKYATDLSSLWTYNGMDCCYTHELFNHLYGELEQRGLVTFYNQHYVEMFQPLLAMMTHGVQVNVKGQKEWCKKLLLECAELRQGLKEIAGEDLYAVKDFSPKKLMRFFYETLNLPKRFNRKTRKPSLDAKALGFLINKYDKAREPGKLLLDHRSKAKMASFMKGAWDKDGKIRCSYKFTTEAGRLKSAKNPMRKGYNLQNPDRRIRDTFLPDKGTVFIRIDMSQIEDRIVKMYTRQPKMVELANRHPSEYDAHTHNATMIFKIPESEVDYDRRYFAKKVVHGSQRALGANGLSEALLKEGYVKAPKQCQVMIDSYFREFPEILEHYFPFIRQLIMKYRSLTNTWGRVINFKYDQLDADLYRRGYSWPPQSECADLLNQWGIVPAYKYVVERGLETRLNMQIHDEVAASCPPSEAYDYAMFVVKSLEQPRWYFGNKLVVPAEVTIGKSWKDSRFEFKRMPSRKEFDEVVYSVYDEVMKGENNG